MPFIIILLADSGNRGASHQFPNKRHCHHNVVDRFGLCSMDSGDETVWKWMGNRLRREMGNRLRREMEPTAEGDGVGSERRKARGGRLDGPRRLFGRPEASKLEIFSCGKYGINWFRDLS